MTAPLAKRRVFVICALVCTVATVVSLTTWCLVRQSIRNAQDLTIWLVPPSAGQATTVFVVSNSTARPIGGRADFPQIYTNRTWSQWAGGNRAARPVFYLQPGQMTNMHVVVPDDGKSFRVPFLWGDAETTRFRVLRSRLENLIYYRKAYGRWDGWRSTGSFACRTNFWEADGSENSEPSSRANRRQPSRF